MNTQEAIQLCCKHLKNLSGKTLDLITIEKPQTIESALNLAKIISKLSPILGNLIEFNTVDFLNEIPEFQTLGTWIRQDPGFPDAIFEGSILPKPGFEIKAWFPLATEITARFKDSQKLFLNDETYVVLLAWLPEFLIFGKPHIVKVGIFSGKSIASTRDSHYHNPPDYLVLEPEDTSKRTRNLQQTNTIGEKWQDTRMELKRQAETFVNSWGDDAKNYQFTNEYQKLLRELKGRFPYYRQDTNFAKIDRINHPEIEKFKKDVFEYQFKGKTIREWNNLFSPKSMEDLRFILETKSYWD